MGRSPVDPKFAELLVVLAEATGAKLTEERIRVYAGLLADLTIPELKQAVYRCARELDTRFLPADPELRLPSVAQILSFAHVAEQDAGLVAWAALQQAASAIGAYASLEVEDSAVALALGTVFGSWADFCAYDLEGPAGAQRRQEFLAAYKTARRRIGESGKTVRLIGLCEGGNYQGGPLVWAGRLLSNGTVDHVRERPLLKAPKAQKALTD